KSMQFSAAAVEDAFVAGHLLMLDSYSYVLGHLPEKVDFAVSVQPPPRMPGDSVPAHTSLLALTASCVERERAIDLIRFACDRPGQELLAASLHNVPARREIALAGSYAGRCPNGMTRVLAG